MSGWLLLGQNSQILRIYSFQLREEEEREKEDILAEKRKKQTKVLIKSHNVICGVSDSVVVIVSIIYIVWERRIVNTVIVLSQQQSESKVFRSGVGKYIAHRSDKRTGDTSGGKRPSVEQSSEGPSKRLKLSQGQGGFGNFSSW